MQEQLKQYEVKLRELMVPENLGAIVCLLNSLRLHSENRVCENEYKTVVYAAALDGQDELIRAVVNYVGQNNNIQ
jgi:hypothetical protein